MDYQKELSTHYPLTADEIERFRRDGFIRLSGVFPPDLLDYYGEEFEPLVFEHSPQARVPLEERSAYHQSFLQVTNLWRVSPLARTLSFSRRLARIASELLGTRGVRMYHDQALFKESGGRPTAWHVDQQYWPLGSDLCVTAWIPLQEVTASMGPLGFVRGSHQREIGRDLPISDESDRAIEEIVRRDGLEFVCEPFAAGDVSFHYGWTVHRAAANSSGRCRRVHTVIYMDADMRLAETMTATQRTDHEAFSPSTEPGGVMADPLNPILYQGTGRGA